MLKKADIDRIEEEAESILQEVFGNLSRIQLPVDINTLVNYYHLQLQKVIFKDQDVAGSFDRHLKKIMISSKDASWRQAFTVAHELGHYRLHLDANQETYYRMDIPKVDGVSQLDKREQEANWFAASILMPKQLVIEFWMLSTDIEKLADIFGVSRSAMLYRLKNLGLLNNDQA